MNILQIIAENARQNPVFAVIIGFLFFFLSQLLLVQPFLYLLALLAGVGFEEMVTALQDSPAQLSGGLMLFRVAQGGGQMLSWGVAAFLIAAILGKPAAVLAIGQPVKPLVAGTAALLILVSFPVVQLLTFRAETLPLPEALQEWGSSLQAAEAKYQELLFQLLGDTRPLILLLNIAVFALVPAFCEELFFRGFLQRRLAMVLPAHAAVWITGLIFALFHFQLYGFLARWLLGALLGYLLMYSKSLWPSITGHFVFNLLNILLVYTAAVAGWPREEAMDQGARMPLALGVLGVAALVAVFILYHRLTTQKDE